MEHIFKNNKINISDIWIPNIDLLLSQENSIKVNKDKQKKKISKEK
jgi:hypothetical protein